MSAIASGFVGQRLTEARHARGLSATALADLVNVSVQSISKYENGHQVPKLDVLHEIATTLRFPRAYFLRPLAVPDQRPVFWRGKLSAPPAARDRAGARLSWMKEVVDYVGGFFDFRPLNVPRFFIDDFEAVSDADLKHFAAQVREHWSIRPGPMPDVVEKLELNGILVSRIHVRAEKLDAFSQWSDRFDIPFVVLGRDKASAVRQRFDALHELAHITLHADVPERRLNDRAFYNLIEKQADRLAAHMLLPEKEFAEDLFSASLDGLLSLKERWGASVGAMIMRCRSLGILDEDDARVMWINYNRRGWRNGEPLDGRMAKERPYVIRRCFEKLFEANVQTPSDVLAALPFPPTDLEEIADLEPGTLTGEAAGRPEPMFKGEAADKGNVVPFSRDRTR
jgi:Zn-dependent peptidase ImmA (M78 family)/transcriptional regulator with XRE-family HTH domain